MVMISGVRPFHYENQHYPLLIPSGYNPGVLNQSSYLGTFFCNLEYLSQAWFALKDELRSLPSGHPDFNFWPSGVILARSIIYIDPSGIEGSTSNIYYVGEPDPSGLNWRNASGLYGQIQQDIYRYYIEDLRNVNSAVFSGIVNDYYGLNYTDIRNRYLRAYFPNVSGYTYFGPDIMLFHAINLAEVQYNPYPRIGSKSQWSPSGDFTKNVNNGWSFFKISDNRYENIYNTIAKWKSLDSLNKNSSSFPGFLPFPNEVFAKFASLDCMGAVFPPCQTLDGRLVQPSPVETSGEKSWWGDSPALGYNIGTYTLNNQSGIVHNSINDSYSNYAIDVDVSGFIALTTYPTYNTTDYWYADPVVYGMATFLPLDILGFYNNPLNYGYDPSDFSLGYMGWYKQKWADTIRIDGDAINNGCKLYIVEPINRSYDKWTIKDLKFYSSTNTIMQSGCREVADYENRNANVGVNWCKYPCINQGFPSYSGEPVSQIAAYNDFLDIPLSGLTTRRAWFKMSNTSTPADDEEILTVESPIFANRNNVKQILIKSPSGFLNSDGILASGYFAPSGELSIWPQDEDFLNGSGIGYHVMDKGIWMRRGPASCGMVLLSPYNGQRLLFKKADDRPFIFSESTGTYRSEIRCNLASVQGDYIGYLNDEQYSINVNDIASAALRNFTGNRAYQISWYNSCNEHMLHTNGYYLIYNVAAQAENEKISMEDYFVTDTVYDKDCYYPQCDSDVATIVATSKTDDALVTNSWFYGKENLAPPICFFDNYFKFSPLQSQATLIDTISVETTFNDDYDGDTKYSDIRVYIAKKPYGLWNIPGLDINATGLAEVNMSAAMLNDLVGNSITAYGVSTFSFYDVYVDPVPTPSTGVLSDGIGLDGWIVLRLETFGWQESSKAGYLEGWGRLFPTFAAGIDAFDYISVVDPPTLPGYTFDYLFSIVRFNNGVYSIPDISFSRDKKPQFRHWSGSKAFRVWVDLSDPTTINCVDDLYDSQSYGIIYNDKIWRYHAADKDHSVSRIPIYSVHENMKFIPNEGDINNLYYAFKCIKSITYIEDEVIALVDVYRDYSTYNGVTWSTMDNLSEYSFSRPFEIATLKFDTDHYNFDNERSKMLIRDVGRRFLRYPDVGFGDLSHYLAPYKYTYDNTITYDANNRLEFDFESTEVSEMWPKIVYANLV